MIGRRLTCGDRHDEGEGQQVHLRELDHQQGEYSGILLSHTPLIKGEAPRTPWKNLRGIHQGLRRL
jgi:hypothetical protein